MTTPQQSAALTAAAIAIHDADCGDTKCSGSALGHCYRLATAALEAAGPHLAAELPAVEGEPLTHFFHCWRFPDHHRCAVALIERQARENDALRVSADARVCVLAAARSEGAAAERKRIARAIEQAVCEPGDQCADRFCPDCVRYAQAMADAAIARAGQ